MAVPGPTTAVYLFAILAMSTGVVILVHFLSTKNEISFTVVYIWHTAVLTFAFLAMMMLLLIKKSDIHLENVSAHREQNMYTGSKIARGIFLVLSGTGSGILPLFETWQDFSCTNSTINKTFYTSKIVSLVLSGIFFVVELVFFACTRYNRCKSGFSRVLLSFILSANVSMLTNFILNVIRASNTNTKQESEKNATEDFTKLLVFSYCENMTEHIGEATTIAEHIYKYTNTFILEFGLLAFGVLIPMWNIIAHTSEDTDVNVNRRDDEVLSVVDRDDNDANSTENLDSDRTAGNGGVSSTEDTNGSNQTDDVNLIPDDERFGRIRLIKVLKMSLEFVSLHSFYFTLIFALPILGFHIYSEVNNMVNEKSDVILEDIGRNVTLSRFEEGNYYLQTSYNYVISIVPFIGYLIAMDFDVSIWRVKSDNVLLIASGCGILLLVLLETADSISGFLSTTSQNYLTQEIVYFVKIIFHYIGIYFQIMLIMKARVIAQHEADDKKTRRLFIKGIIIFLGVCNTERWLVDSFLPPTNLRFVNDIQNDDTFGIKNWWFITNFLFPVVTFYRLLSALLCFEVRDRFQERNSL